MLQGAIFYLSELKRWNLSFWHGTTSSLITATSNLKKICDHFVDAFLLFIGIIEWPLIEKLWRFKKRKKKKTKLHTCRPGKNRALDVNTTQLRKISEQSCSLWNQGTSDSPPFNTHPPPDTFKYLCGCNMQSNINLNNTTSKGLKLHRTPPPPPHTRTHMCGNCESLRILTFSLWIQVNNRQFGVCSQEWFHSMVQVHLKWLVWLKPLHHLFAGSCGCRCWWAVHSASCYAQGATGSGRPAKWNPVKKWQQQSLSISFVPKKKKRITGWEWYLETIVCRFNQTVSVH